MLQFSSNQLFLGLMPDCDNGLIVPADVMDREEVPHAEKFSECILQNFLDLTYQSFFLRVKNVL